MGIQDLLDNPNDLDPAQLEAFELFQKDLDAYKIKIKEQAARNVPDSWKVPRKFRIGGEEVIKLQIEWVAYTLLLSEIKLEEKKN